ncbi:unnamed protein product [Phytomonas sp. Hart1]|nr:unnamed protein product [Phytomonas sp. Hart1]|eukprot:CCW71735.1 unnamed protein product [Phytomonas sp. isolate Hart1]
MPIVEHAPNMPRNHKKKLKVCILTTFLLSSIILITLIPIAAMNRDPNNGATFNPIKNPVSEMQNEVQSTPLLSQPEPLTLTCALARAYETDDEFYNQVLSLFLASPESGASVYRAIRYARGDGNCFYRCVSFRLYELMLQDLVFGQHTLMIMQNTIRPRMHQQFGEGSMDFCFIAEGIAQRICNGELYTVDMVYEAVVNREKADYLILYFRYALSIYLRDHADEFVPFVMGLGFSSVEQYCETEVEPLSKESDNVEVRAFGQLFDVTIQVEAMYPKAGKLTTIQVGSVQGKNAHPPSIIYLLLQPGHYDLLES